MSLHEQCNTLHQRLIKKINSWPPDTVSTTLMGNLSNNFSYISNNFTYNFNNLSANFSGSSIKSNSTSSSTPTNSDPPTKANQQNGKLPSPSSFMPPTNGKPSNFLPSPAAGISNGKPTSNELKPAVGPETDGHLSLNGKSFKSTTPISSPTHSQASSLSSNSIVQVNNTKLDEDLIDVICKLNQKCEFLNRFGQRHDYTGKQVNGYFSMLRIIYSFFEYVFNQKKRKMFPEIIEVGKLLLHVLNAMEEYTKKYAELRLRYDNGDYNFDLLTDYEDDDEIGKKKGDLSGKSNSDGSSSEDELDEINNFDNISSNLVKMSSHLALSLESMKSSIFDDLANNNETYDAIEEEDDEEKEKIEDYFRNNDLKDNEDDKEYGKEIKKEEYESTLQKYYKRFNFNFKLSKSKSCTSPVNEGGSPKKSITSASTSSSSTGAQRPDSPSKKPVRPEKKYYKYFSNLRNNFEENFNKFTNNSNSETGLLKTISDDTTTGNSPKNGKLPNSASSNALKKEAHQDGDFLEDSLDQEELNQETEEEKKLRNAKLDEYILSKFPITNDDLYLVTPPLLYFYQGFTLTLNRERELSLIYGRVGPFWYTKSAANIVSLVRNLVVILTSKPSKSITSLYNTDQCARIFAHRQVNATLDSLLQGLATLEIKAYNRRYFKYLYREHVIYGRTLRMPVQSLFEIPVEGNELIRHKEGETPNGESKSKPNGSTVQEENKEVTVENVGFNSRTVRCRLINYVRAENEAEICENSHKCLLVHHHGGGFVLSSPDSHELYLRDWAVKLKGIPILSVDYTLRQPYPKAPQDVLDVYMYLVDPKNKLAVSEMIGFQPEKIVIAGDSAGANLVFSLICCLNEIKRNYPEYANLKMPSSIVCVYGAFDIRGVMSPSKFISAFDPILHHGNIMAMIGTYAGINQKIRPTLWSRIKYRRSIAWYRVSERELMARFKSLSKAMESFFASPLNYPRLEDLKDISLHLISTHYCPLIDDSVVLYKAWQGPSTFDIFDGLPHAFLNFSDRSEEAKIATNKVAERIVLAFRRTPTNDQKTKTN